MRFLRMGVAAASLYWQPHCRVAGVWSRASAGSAPQGASMSVFESPDFDNHEEVAFFADPKSGLRAVIAIHSTALGPSCGGTRMYAYPTSDAALTDVLRLSRGMSYKNAIADLPLGGGKA